eukprot:Em0001g1901a
MSCGRTLNKYIINTFQERNPKIKIELIEVEKTSLDVYNLENVERILGPPGRDAFDLVEVDTVLLGEIVDSNLLQPIEIDTSRFLPQAAKAVTYNRKTYGFPTMVCSNFLVTTSNPKGTTHSDALIGKFTGSWTRSQYYLNAYINIHGADSLYKGVDSNPCEEREALDAVKVLSESCKTNGQNPCTENWSSKDMIDAVVKSKESTFLGYSETIGEALMKAPGLKITSIKPPPLAIDVRKTKTLVYTDAVVMNSHMDNEKREAAIKFIDYYTSTELRLDLALCKDFVKPHKKCVRYELPADLQFYANPRLPKETLFQQFHSIIDTLGVSGPNHRLYYKKNDIANAISKCPMKLNTPRPTS